MNIRQTLHLQACFWGKLGIGDICPACEVLSRILFSLLTLYWCLSLYSQIIPHLLLSTTHLVLHVSYTTMQCFSNCSTEKPIVKGLEPVHMGPDLC